MKSLIRYIENVFFPTKYFGHAVALSKEEQVLDALNYRGSYINRLPARCSFPEEEQPYLKTKPHYSYIAFHL